MSKNARSNNNATRNTARPTAARNAQQVRKQPAKHSRKAKQPKMASSNKWMIIIGVAFLALRLIFPDLMAILGSSLKGLTVVAVVAIVIAIAANMNGLSVPDFIANLFNGLMGIVKNRKPQSRRAPSYYEEDEYDDYDDYEEEEEGEVEFEFDDDAYEDYDDLSAAEVGKKPVVRKPHHRMPSEGVPQGTFDDTPPITEPQFDPEMLRQFQMFMAFQEASKQAVNKPEGEGDTDESSK